jgi:hypothetical protein
MRIWGWKEKLLTTGLAMGLAFAASGCASRSASAQSTACKPKDAPGCAPFAQETRKRWQSEQAVREEESRRNAFTSGNRPTNSGGR